MAIVFQPDRFITVRALPSELAVPVRDIRRFKLAGEEIQPDTISWVTPDDYLNVYWESSLAGVQVQVIGRVLTWDGDVTIFGGHFTTDGTRVLSSNFFQLGYGFMLGATCYSFGSPTPARGQVLAQLVLLRAPNAGALIHYGLGMDYLTRANVINWPFSRVTTGVEGPGALTSVLGTAPAAGADFSQTVPTNARWKVRGVKALFTASAAVATRQPQLSLTAGGQAVGVIPAQINVTAGQSIFLQWLPGFTPASAPPNNPAQYLVPDLQLRVADVIASSTIGLQAGDQWGAPIFYVEENLEG